MKAQGYGFAHRWSAIAGPYRLTIVAIDIEHATSAFEMFIDDREVNEFTRQLLKKDVRIKRLRDDNRQMIMAVGIDPGT